MRAALVGAALFVVALPAMAAPDDYTSVERGRALATAGDCMACHTAPGRPARSSAVLGRGSAGR